MNYYTTNQLSERLEITPEGYLLCRAVPIARTGALEYLPEEVPPEIAAGASGPTVLAYRTSEELFSPQTLASFEGKDVVVMHPDDFLTAENWKELACGHAQSVRRGEGEEADLLLADLLIKDKDTIELILPSDGGKPTLREISCGYDADYELIAPGIGKQVHIIGNHIALVPHGRCGSRCSIKDKEIDMPKKKGFWESIFNNEKVKKAMADAAEEQKEEPGKKETEGGAVTDNAEIGEKLDELLIIARSLLDVFKPKDEEPAKDRDSTKDGEEGTADEETTADNESAKDEDPKKEQDGKTGDSRSRTADAATISGAGKLAPNMRFRVGDNDSAVKRAALSAAMNDKAVEELVTACLGGVPLSNAGGTILDAAFSAAASFVHARNNDRTSQAFTKFNDEKRDAAPITPAQINEINRKFRNGGKE